MLTYRFKIINLEDLNLSGIYEYPIQYSYMFRHIYKNLDLTKDNIFIKETLEKFPLFDKSIYDFCLTECLDKYKKWEVSQKKLQESIVICDIRYSYLTSKEIKSKGDKREIRKLSIKIPKIKKRVGKQIVFGGLKRLQNVTHFSNIGDKEKYENHLIEYKKHRVWGLYCIGRACEGGNRKFDFDLLNNTITFKPSINKQFHLKVIKPSNLSLNMLEKIQFLINLNDIPISVRLYPTEIQISLDNERLNGFHFNKNECKKECIGKTKEESKEIYKKWYDEQQNRKLEGKNPNRILAVDLNNKNIGFSIMEIIYDKKPTVLFTRSYNLNKLVSKYRRKETGNNNDKLKYELSKIYQQIFKIAEHFKCSKFSMEDIDFKSNVTSKSKDFNRLTKNIWCRGLQEGLITKYCENLGIELIKVNPVYSSFIGNVIYDYFDPISASLEIGRRGFYKYIKGASMYPPIEWIPERKISYLFGVNSLSEMACPTWVKLYKIATSRNSRYRNLNKFKISDHFMNKYSFVYISL